MEFNTTLFFIKKYLPQKCHILDAGGGPGRYTVTLAKMGYDVTLLDYTPELLEIAKKKIRDENVSDRVINVAECSVTDLSQFDDNSFDAVLCLGGVLSHLLKECDRDKALLELRRVARKSAPLFISVIGKLAIFKRAPIYFPEEIGMEHMDVFRDTGDYFGGYGFTKMHGFLLEDFKKEIIKNRLKTLEFVGLEGLSASLEKYINELAKDKKRWKSWIKTHYKTCKIPSVIDTSEHILCVCKK
ncbi:MAG: class I SAM-dependent methyltransferase [Candidatus Methanofastidiosia archaeon]